MTWHAKRELDGGGGGGRGGEREKTPPHPFSLQPALFSPLSPGHRTPAGTHLIMHTAWRRGHSGTKKVLGDRLCTLEKFLHNIQQVISQKRMCAMNIYVIIWDFAVRF